MPQREILTIAYYPQFDSSEEYTNHYYRACWYFPTTDIMNITVTFPISNTVTLLDIPDYFDDAIQDYDAGHINTTTPDSDHFYAGADVILLWQSPSEKELKELKEKFNNKRIYTVATACLNAKEFGQYPRVLWDNLDYKRKRTTLIESEKLFRQHIQHYKQVSSSDTAFIIGTGPSVDQIFDHDLSDHFVIGCNSVVKSQDLIQHCGFDIICAGDVVSHFSPCQYAAVFRRDLKAFLAHSDGLFFTTALFGYLLWVRWPELRHKIILCEQDLDKPNVDLMSHWGLPKLDSVLNIHMLPIASTVARHLTLIGFDGKSANKEDNEDFWGHSSSAQYHEFVETGHAMHPTFDTLRQQTTENRFIQSTAYSVDVLKMSGKRLRSLAPSHTPAINQLYDTTDS